jgi:hypothetical protein
MGDQRIRLQLSAGPRDIFLFHGIQTGSEPHPASYTMSTWVLFPRGMRLGSEVHFLPPPSAEVKNMWSCASTPSYVGMM